MSDGPVPATLQNSHVGCSIDEDLAPGREVRLFEHPVAAGGEQDGLAPKDAWQQLQAG